MDASELINETSVLFSPPIVYRRLTELLDEPEQNQDEIAEIISHDPGLIARVLKAANDVPYAAKHKIGDVYDAIAAINADDLRTLITTATAVETFSHVDTDLVDMNNFWNHSISCGLAAQVLAERCGHANPDQVFIAVWLHRSWPSGAGMRTLINCSSPVCSTTSVNWSSITPYPNWPPRY